MILTCPQCATRYQTDASMFAAPGRNVRCAKCAHLWFQAPPEPEPELQPEPEPEVQRHADAALGPMAPDGAVAYGGSAAMPPIDDGERARGRSGFGRLAGWLVLIAVVGAVLFFILQYRQTIATLWPKSASAYAALGMRVNVRGLDIQDLAPAHTMEGTQPVLEVKGRIVNITDHRIPVPPVRVSLIDSEAREVYHWTFDSGVGTLGAGAGGAFVTRLTAPPQEAKDLSIRFSEPGEQ